MAKKLETYIKLQIPAGKANPSPPVGPALGQHQINIMDFCNEFNARTKDFEPDLPVPVVISLFSDRSFTFVTKITPASNLLKKVMGISKGSSNPNSNKVGKITRAQLEEVARAKFTDLTAADMEAAVKTIVGTARSMGLETEVV